MKQVCRTGFRALWSIGLCMMLTGIFRLPCLAQDKAPTQTAGVDNTKMGAYRALAQLSFHAFQKGDNAKYYRSAQIPMQTALA